MSGSSKAAPALTRFRASARAKVDIRSESDEKIDQLVTAAAQRRCQRGGNRERARHWLQGHRRSAGDRKPARLRGSPATLPSSRESARSMPTSEFAPASTAPRRTPIFRSPWEFPPFASARAGREAARTRPREWYRSAGRDLGLKRILLTAGAAPSGQRARMIRTRTGQHGKHASAAAPNSLWPESRSSGERRLSS